VSPGFWFVVGFGAALKAGMEFATCVRVLIAARRLGDDRVRAGGEEMTTPEIRRLVCVEGALWLVAWVLGLVLTVESLAAGSGSPAG